MRITRTNGPVVLVDRDHLETTASFYSALLAEPVRGRFRNPAAHLDIVVVGSAIIIGGTDAALEARRGMAATFVVDSVEEWRQRLVDMGATVVEPPGPGPFVDDRPIGTFMFVRHPDGGLYEYFELSNPSS